MRDVDRQLDIGFGQNWIEVRFPGDENIRNLRLDRGKAAGAIF